MAVLIVFCVLVVMFFVFLFALYLSIFCASKATRQTDPIRGLESPFLEGRRDFVRSKMELLSCHPCEEIRTKSRDGVTLFGRYYSDDESAPICIIFHGYKGSSYTEPSALAVHLLSCGISVLVTDHRAHGQSGGASITFGIKERYDALYWCEYINNRWGHDRKILLAGVSMGASSVLMASELCLPRGVCGIIADCPYSEPKAIIKRVISNKGLPARLIYPAIRLSALVFGHFNLGASSPVSAVRKAQIPIMLIHGSADNFVPLRMSEEIYEACASEKTLLTIKGAKHGGCFATDPEKYSSAVLQFIEKATKQQNEPQRGIRE